MALVAWVFCGAVPAGLVHLGQLAGLGGPPAPWSAHPFFLAPTPRTRLGGWAALGARWWWLPGFPGSPPSPGPLAGPPLRPPLGTWGLWL